MAQYSHATYIHGGVGAPVGLTVFKTAEGSLGAVPGGFDSHTPLPILFEMLLCAVFLPIGFADSARLCFPFSPAELCFPFPPKESSLMIELQHVLVLTISMM